MDELNTAAIEVNDLKDQGLEFIMDLVSKHRRAERTSKEISEVINEHQRKC